MKRFFTALAVSVIGAWMVCASAQCTIVMTGDILLDRGVRQVIDHRGVDALFSRSIDSLFREADVVVGNLECPATKIESPVQKRFIFRMESPRIFRKIMSLRMIVSFEQTVMMQLFVRMMPSGMVV